MMKYIFCIFICALLILGVNDTSNKDLQGFRCETGISANYTSSCFESESCTFTIATENPGNDFQRLLGNINSGLTVNDAILGNFSATSGTTPSKILKFNPLLSVVQMLSLLNSQKSEAKCDILYDPQFIKYSHKYYLYTLSRILI